ncbi:MAG: cytochrome b561 domain-containing protein [Pseudomonadota bacterium]
MIDWLLLPIDTSRPHDLDMAAAWHGRFMVVAWAFLLPIGILAARYLKVTPRQDWPREVDSRLWWRTHRTTQYAGTAATILALVLVWQSDDYGARVHPLLGYATVILCLSQVLAAWLRGTKGGPTEPTLAGDHYDMTPRRRAFELFHKFAGYAALMLACAAILTGLWVANGYRWMLVGVVGWWAVLAALFVIGERRGMCVDTYQAIWGPGTHHPGNRIPPIGVNVQRPDPEARRSIRREASTRA